MEDLLEAALDVLRPLQRMSDGRGNTYCATCKQPDRCARDCKHGAVLALAEGRRALDDGRRANKQHK